MGHANNNTKTKKYLKKSTLNHKHRKKLHIKNLLVS